MSRQGPRSWSRWSAWRSQHRAAARDSWAKLAARPMATAVTWLVVAISLALPGTLLLTLDNLAGVAGSWDDSARISVLLDDTADHAAAEALGDAVEAWPEVVTLALVDKDQALTDFVTQTGLLSLVGSLPRNPLPHTLLVYPDSTLAAAELASLTTRLQSLPSVHQAVMDARWIARLEAALRTVERWVRGLGALMVLGAILLLGNTLRLAIEARHEELLVVSLIGGTKGFARRPFLYTGLWYGAGGGVMAALLLWLLSLWVSGPVNDLFMLYDSARQLDGPGLSYALTAILAGASVGWLAAWIASARVFRRLDTA